MPGIIFSLLSLGFLLGSSIAVHIKAAHKSPPDCALQLKKRAGRMAAGSVSSFAAAAWLLYI